MTPPWRSVTIDDIKAGAENALATGPFGSSISSRFFTNAGVPVIRGSNLSEEIGNRLVEDDYVFVSSEKAREFRRSLVRSGDLVFTCWGTIGQVGIVDKRSRFSEYIVSNKQMKLTPDSMKADSLFLYYVFSSSPVRDEIRNQAIGSSVPGFNLGQLRRIRFNLPPLPDQRAIAHILSTLDDKIELNRRQNETLEAMARALFKSWFVDFDPVRAKAEGRRPEGMDEETAGMFPRSFVKSELGPIPQSWRAVQWGDLVTLEYGKGLVGYQHEEGAFPVYGTNGPIGSHSEALCPHPGIIVGRKGAYRGIHFSTKPFYVIDTAYYVEPRGKLDLRWAYYSLLNEDINSMDSGSAIPSTSRDDFYGLPIVAPPDTLQERFAGILEPLWSRQEANDLESRTLAALRDTLLPKLLSGEIRVADAQKLVEPKLL
ncbi:MAG: restriction endonuclease subunit S [Planctomycetes bacterium]|nr:restriction endonuclease subunit S [Planctomycetota bacterium]